MAAGETTRGERDDPNPEDRPETRAGEHDQQVPAALDRTERRQLDVVRRFGTTGSLILAVGAIGAGAAPVSNPVAGVRLLGIPVRMPTVAMACAWLGMMMLVMAWLWLGKLCWPRRPRTATVTQLVRTLVMWSLPLAVAPPLFSTDMYGYLAQSEVAARGFDPYAIGSAAALGVDHPFVSNVPNIWRDTPSPYGPLFLMFGQLISRIVGDDVVFGVLVWRVVMLLGLGLAIWAVPRLARRCGVHPTAAMWLGVLNPVVLFHVVSGMHNEALMVGLMLAAIEFGLRKPGAVGLVITGVLLTVAGAIKPPAFVALGFFGISIVLGRGGRFRDLFAVAAQLLAVFLATMTVITVASGWGLGWIETFDVPNRVKTFMAPLTALGMTGGGISTLLGLGNHTDAMLVITKIIGYLLTGVVCLRMLWLSFRGRLQPLAGLGITLGVLAVAVPVLWPWYLVWSVIPLAVATNDNRFRITAMVVSAAVSLLVPPTGAGYLLRAYQIPLAVTAALIAFAVAVMLVRRKAPWPVPARGRARPVTS